MQSLFSTFFNLIRSLFQPSSTASSRLAVHVGIARYVEDEKHSLFAEGGLYCSIASESENVTTRKGSQEKHENHIENDGKNWELRNQGLQRLLSEKLTIT